MSNTPLPNSFLKPGEIQESEDPSVLPPHWPTILTLWWIQQRFQDQTCFFNTLKKLICSICDGVLCLSHMRKCFSNFSVTHLFLTKKENNHIYIKKWREWISENKIRWIIFLIYFSLNSCKLTWIRGMHCIYMLVWYRLLPRIKLICALFLSWLFFFFLWGISQGQGGFPSSSCLSSPSCRLTWVLCTLAHEHSWLYL